MTKAVATMSLWFGEYRMFNRVFWAPTDTMKQAWPLRQCPADRIQPRQCQCRRQELGTLVRVERKHEGLQLRCFQPYQLLQWQPEGFLQLHGEQQGLSRKQPVSHQYVLPPILVISHWPEVEQG